MPFKVQPHADTLCATCRYSQIVEFRRGPPRVFCHEGGSAIDLHAAVVSCNEFTTRHGGPQRHEMEKIAWVVTTDKSGQTIGFQPPMKGLRVPHE